jgi:tellurite resistance protein
MVFLIIFGTRGVTTTAESGDFFCPACDKKRRYDHKLVRRFFTLYFIPLIPMGTVGEYIECQTCRGTYKPAVLAYDPDAHDKKLEAEFLAAIKRVMVLMMLADKKIEESEIETIQAVYEKLAKKPLARSDVDAEVAAAQKDGRSLARYLETLVGSLNDNGKESVVKAAFFVASADGKVTEDETRLLAELAAALEMSPTHFKGVVDGLVAALGDVPTHVDAHRREPSVGTEAEDHGRLQPAGAHALEARTKRLQVAVDAGRHALHLGLAQGRARGRRARGRADGPPRARLLERILAGRERRRRHGARRRFSRPRRGHLRGLARAALAREVGDDLVGRAVERVPARRTEVVVRLRRAGHLELAELLAGPRLDDVDDEPHVRCAGGFLRLDHADAERQVGRSRLHHLQRLEHASVREAAGQVILERRGVGLRAREPVGVDRQRARSVPAEVRLDRVLRGRRPAMRARDRQGHDRREQPDAGTHRFRRYHVGARQIPCCGSSRSAASVRSA